MAGVTLRDVVKVYGRHIAVRGIDLDIPDGAFMVLVGPSGCGKSTTLRMIAGLETISHGELRIDGRLANEVEPRDRPGVEVLARLPVEQGGHPLLVTGRFGAGRSVAWTSDIGPHWLPEGFVQWPGYATLWRNVLAWVTAAG